MSDENRIVATVERIGIRRRSEESARVFAEISFPASGAGREDIMLLLISQMRNELGVTFDVIQPRLPNTTPPPNPPAQRVGKVVASSGEPILPHVYASEKDGGACIYCDLRKEHEIHIAAPAPEKLAGRRRGRAASEAPAAHAYVESTETPGLCATCHLREGDDVHKLSVLQQEAAAEDAASADAQEAELDAQMDPLALSLLQEARRAPQDEAEASEQADAMANLAARGAATAATT